MRRCTVFVCRWHATHQCQQPCLPQKQSMTTSHNEGNIRMPCTSGKIMRAIHRRAPCTCRRLNVWQRSKESRAARPVQAHGRTLIWRQAAFLEGRCERTKEKSWPGHCSPDSTHPCMHHPHAHRHFRDLLFWLVCVIIQP